jgi:hypothetical protein
MDPREVLHLENLQAGFKYIPTDKTNFEGVIMIMGHICSYEE